MARSSSIVLVAILSLTVFMAVESNGMDREAEVREAVDAFGRAFAEADVATLKSLLHENYVHVNGRSGNVLNRAEWLEWVTSRRREMQSGELVVNEYRIKDLQIVLSEATAIVVGVVISSQSRNGKSTESRIRFTNLWVHRKGGWFRAAFHDSAIPLTNS